MLKKYGFVYDNHVQNAFKSKDWLDSMYSRIFSAGVTSSDKSYMKSFLAKHKPPSDVPLTVAQLCNLRPEHGKPSFYLTPVFGVFSAGVTSSDKSYMKSFLVKHKPPSDVPLTVAQLCNLRPEH
ncbi:uncharacterized protein LOC113472659, partial [Diaphorina citri]|uniref:Uncharacterized protein LOC113472659 n=1 Tax=Diaphorina citri TaxID=121845 RepID=A0A3Q0JIN3_DIACI